MGTSGLKLVMQAGQVVISASKSTTISAADCSSGGQAGLPLALQEVPAFEQVFGRDRELKGDASARIAALAPRPAQVGFNTALLQ